MMSAPKYQYGHKPAKRRPRKALAVFVFSLLFIAVVGALVYADLRKHVAPTIEGESRVVSQVLNDNAATIDVDEPLFFLELPGDWKETARNDNNLYTSISWQATSKGKDNRYLTLYVDRIPTDLPFNRLVALRPQGNTLSFSDVSDNCVNFTLGGSADNRAVSTSKPAPTKWNKVDFMCNLPQANDNVIGTSSEGAMNSVTVSGPTQGEHKYFFVYTDRNFQPDYNILYNVLRSFRAK